METIANTKPSKPISIKGKILKISTLTPVFENYC